NTSVLNSMVADVVSHSLNLLETLKESIENNKLSDVKDAVEDLLISRINLAVAGERGPEKSAFINALRGLGPEDEGATLSPCPTSPEEMAIYPNPKHLDFRFWDPPPQPRPLTRKGIWSGPTAWRCSWKPDLCRGTLCTSPCWASEKDIEKGLEERRKASLELLKAQGVALPKVFLVRPSCLEKRDIPGLLEEMERDLPEIREFPLSTCCLLFLHSAIQLIPNHLNWFEVG
uniref:IRG-type G domain-containing protein n=1 Tax=Hucho hucho TaxID=62062 RepID=A0A4W5RNH9_9TELE